MALDDDKTLIEQAKKGDREAFRALLERHYGLIHRVAWRFTGHAQDAEDIAQEVCAGLPRKLASFRSDSSVSTWLYRVVVNACRDLHKKRKNHRALEQRYKEMEAHELADRQLADKQVAWLYRIISKIGPPLQETALLVLAEGLSHAEAGKILGCAENTISWRMHELKKHIKAAMDDGHD